MSTKTKIAQILERFAALHEQDIDLGLDRMIVLLQRLGNPHQSLPPVVHVAGTNGKGSTIAFLAAMAKAQGLRAHVHTSPHLIRLNERYILAGQQISDDQLVRALQAVDAANAGAAATQYELLTAVMFTCFANTPADVAIIEVGLGGELDATNVLPPPALALITPIALEHKDWLGDDLAGIARAKAGIIKPGTKVCSAAQLDEVRDVLVRRAERCRTSIQLADESFQCHVENDHLVWQDDCQLLDLPLPALPGEHQIQNASLAICGALKMGWSHAAIAAGLGEAQWPGRLQAIADTPPFRQPTEIWLDGAHNPHAAQALARFIQTRQAIRPLPLHLILGLQTSKQVQGFLEPLLALSPHIHVVPVKSAPAGFVPQKLTELVRKAGFQADAYDDLTQAIAAISGGGRLVITGSLYLAGEVLAQIKTPTEAAGVSS